MTVALVKVPTVVKLDSVTVDFNVVPDKVPASVVTVMSLLPSNATPLIFLDVVNFVALIAVPAVVALVAVAAFPVISNLLDKAA